MNINIDKYFHMIPLWTSPIKLLVGATGWSYSEASCGEAMVLPVVPDPGPACPFPRRPKTTCSLRQGARHLKGID